MSVETFPGAVFICDHEGNILRVCSEDTQEIASGKSFLSLIGAADLPRASLFWENIRRAEPGSTEFLITLNGSTAIRSCMAGLTSQGILVVISERSMELFELYEELARTNSDQANELRRTIKELTTLKQEGRSRDEAMVTELSLTNNELVNTQRELAKKNRELTNLIRQKNAFLGMAAHDLRNPLAGILGMAAMLHEELALKEQQETVAEIRELATRMLSLVEDYLDLTVVEGGKLELKPECTNLTRLVTRYLHIHENRAEAKGINLTTHLPEAPLFLLCDPGKMAQVVDNLLSNALKFAPTGGSVTISIKREQEMARILVNDSGPGVPEGQREHIFTMFGKAEARTTGGESSTGIGLAIVKRIVTAHEGSISVGKSSLGGAEFEVVLPMAGCSLETETENSPAPEPRVPLHVPGHALIIDDELFNRKLLTRMLEKIRFTSKTAPDASSALPLLQQERFSIIFLDLELPDMHGTELARRIRSEPLRNRLGEIPIIAVTGHTDSRTHDTCRTAGFTAILPKPITPEELEKAVALL